MKVVKETLRLGNVVKFLHRKAIQDIHYQGKVQVFAYICEKVHPI